MAGPLRGAGKNRSSQKAFTLLELLVGIAVSSILLLGLFQLLSDLTTVKETYRERSLQTHEEVALRRLLYQDLYGVPVTKVDFRGNAEEFYRTTVAHSTERERLMETRVHYFTRRQGDKLNLIREWKWVDLHDDFTESSVLLSAKSIDFRYLTESGQTVKRANATQGKIAGVQVQINDSTLTVPASFKTGDEDEEESAGISSRTR